MCRSNIFCLLLGLGIRTFSMDARYLPRMHERLRQLSIHDCEKLTREILAQSQISRITQMLEGGHYPA